LRSDNRGEYTSGDFTNFCKEVRIKREHTVPYNPQQKGVAERKNKSILEAMKAMIHDQDLPMYLWGEACSTTVYVQNRSPRRILGDKTSEEVFTGEKPSVGHLRIFGCPVYFHVAKQKRSKLEPSRKKGTFVGYDETSKGYSIYVPGQRYIEVSRDVTFDEEVAFRRSKRSHMDTDKEEQEAPKDGSIDEPVVHPSDEYDEELADPVEPANPVELPREVALVRKRPA